MTLSNEQKNIIELSKQLKDNETLKVNAFAGTGKTTTLIQITNAIKNETFLYLAFNNDVVKESKKKFNNNVICTTINSLAYKEIVPKNAYKLSSENYTPIYLAELLNIDYSDAYDVLKIYTNFCNSSFKDIEQLKNIYIPKRLSSFDNAKILYEKIKNKEIDCDHLFYVKEFELSNFAKNINVDFILLDEAQDTNDVTLSIFQQFNAKKILVGDTHQSIYQFRNSVNAMEIIKSDYTAYLTTTYRCNQQIVDLANNILKKYKKEKIKLISGVNKQDNTHNEIAYITRTNSKIISLIEKLESFDCTKNIDQIFDLSLSIYKQFISTKNLDTNYQKFQFLSNFRTLEDLKTYSSNIDDIELNGAIKNAQRYKSYLYVLYNKAKQSNSTQSKNKITTAHKSKGLEYDNVIICDDFKNPKNTKNQEEYITEANLLYVAVTRAKKNIYFQNEKFVNEIY